MFSVGRGGRRPPGPRGSFLAGNLPAYERDRLAFFRQMAEEFGDVVRFGSRTTMLNSAAVALPVLRGDISSFAVRENFLQQRLTPAQGRAIYELRASLNPGLRRQAVGRIADISDRRLGEALERMSAEDRTQLDPLPMLEGVISSAVAEFYFGPEASASVAGSVGALLDELSHLIGNPFALPAGFRTATRRRVEVAHRELRMQIAELVGSRGGVDSSTFAAAVMGSVDGRFGADQVIDMVIGSLLAAQRVPAAAASWLLMLLADHPGIQEELHDTASSFEAGSAEPSAGSTLAQCVVLESLRLYPPTWLIVRTSTKPVTVAGFAFPAGHHFMVSPHVLHRDPSVFDNPEAFMPERWIAPGRTTAGFLPFGAGAHLCPGRHLASVVLAAVATTLTRRYAVVREPGVIQADPRTTLQPIGLRVTLTSRPVGPQANRPTRVRRQPLDLAAAPSL